MDVLETLEIDHWNGPFAADVRRRAVEALERGKVVFFPMLPFVLQADERSLLTPALSNGKAKNVSLDPKTGTTQGTVSTGEERTRLQAMMERFAQCATHLVINLFPGYEAGLERARTSYRPVEIVGRSYSPKKDDKLLHVDAFPSRPTGGRRIMRLFSNIDPTGMTRIWHVGEPFEEFARKFLPGVRNPILLEARLLQLLGITKGRRSEYDYLMLGLHDNGKLDARYQKEVLQEEVRFPSGSTWLCFTDQVMHAALGGQFALEQTFHLDVEAMTDPARSPLKVLERMAGRRLV